MYVEKLIVLFLLLFSRTSLISAREDICEGWDKLYLGI